MITATRTGIPSRVCSHCATCFPFMMCLVLTASVVLMLLSAARAQDSGEIPDITGKYHFLRADDLLAILDEEGRLNGYIDVLQGEEESDSILSYPISEGSRKKDHVEFKTKKVHQKYFRFSGTVERGQGPQAPDPDYLRLVGDLEIVTVKGESDQETAQRMHVVFKSLGRDEDKEE